MIAGGGGVKMLGLMLGLSKVTSEMRFPAPHPEAHCILLCTTSAQLAPLHLMYYKV